MLSGSRFIKVLEEPRPETHSETKYLFVNSIALQRLKSLTFVNTGFTSDFTLPRNISKAKELTDGLKKKNNNNKKKTNQTKQNHRQSQTKMVRTRKSTWGSEPGVLSRTSLSPALTPGKQLPSATFRNWGKAMQTFAPRSWNEQTRPSLVHAGLVVIRRF